MTNILQNRCISGKITANEAEVIVNKKKKKEQNYVYVFQKSLMRLASKSIRLEPLVRQTFLQNEKKSIHFCSGYREGNHFHKYTHAQLPCTKRLLFMF
jgi:hypothetical protein